MSLIHPNFTVGFAKNPEESLYPNLWSGLVGLWSPEIGKQGDKLYDWSGFKHHGTLNNMDAGTDYVSGKYGYALNFDGVNDFVDCGNIPEIDNASQNLSLMFWMRSTATASQTLITYDNNSVLQPATDWYCYCATSGNLRIGGFGSTGELDTGITSASLRDGKFHHVAIILKQTTIEVYVDGILRYNPANSKTHGNFGGTFSLQFGAAENVAAYAGDFGEIRLYRRDLQSGEVKQSYLGASPLTPSIQIVSFSETLVELSEDISISDEIEILSPTQNLEETITISDELLVTDSIEDFTENININDELLVNLNTQNLTQDIEITDSLIAELIPVNLDAHFGTRILSINPLIFVTDTNPAEIIKVDTSDPENLTWQIDTIVGLTNAVDATVQTNFAESISTSNTDPTASSNDSSFGSIAWSSVSNILTSDDSRVSVTLSGLTDTNYLFVNDFGFAIPANATITGIRVFIEKRRSGGTTGEVRDSVVKLVKDSVVIGENKAVTTTNWSTTESIITYGTTTDLWQTGWTPDDVNGINFGVVLAVKGNIAGANRLADVDNIKISITYKIAGSRFIYIAGANGKIAKIEFDDLNNQEIIDVVDTDENLTIQSQDNFGIISVGTDNNIGELYLLHEQEANLIDTDITILAPITNEIDTQVNITEASFIDTDIQVLGYITSLIVCDVKVLSAPLDDIIPIKLTDFHVFLDNVELANRDIDLASISIIHTIDQKSTATFKLTRRHDNINVDVDGNTRTITNQNDIRIEIDGKIEFEGKIATINSIYNTSDELNIVCEGEIASYNYSNTPLSLPSFTERLHLYDILTQTPKIDNPYINPTEENPRKFKGIFAPLGKKITQSVARYLDSDISGSIAEGIQNGEFKPRQNWTYFWSPVVRKAGFFIMTDNENEIKKAGLIPRVIETPFHQIKLPVFLTQGDTPFTRIADGDVGAIYFAYVGTSLSPVSEDIWILEAAKHRLQRILPDIVRRLGEGFITEQQIEDLNIGEASSIFTSLITKEYINISGEVLDKFKQYVFSPDRLSIPYSNSIKQAIYDLLDNSFGVYLGEAPYKTVNVRNGIFVPKFRWEDGTDGLYSILDEGYDFEDYVNQIAQLEYEKIQNINGDILPDTSCSITLTVDAYQYFNLKLLNRINIENTIASNIFKNNNGFPVSIKSITINASDRKVSLTTDNKKSTVELEQIDGLFPNEDDFIDQEKRILIAQKSDMNTRLAVD